MSEKPKKKPQPGNRFFVANNWCTERPSDTERHEEWDDRRSFEHSGQEYLSIISMLAALTSLLAYLAAIILLRSRSFIISNAKFCPTCGNAVSFFSSSCTQLACKSAPNNRQKHRRTTHTKGAQTHDARNDGLPATRWLGPRAPRRLSSSTPCERSPSETPIPGLTLHTLPRINTIPGITRHTPAP